MSLLLNSLHISECSTVSDHRGTNYDFLIRTLKMGEVDPPLHYTRTQHRVQCSGGRPTPMEKAGKVRPCRLVCCPLITRHPNPKRRSRK